MSESQGLLLCYNRGCGQKFDSESNKDDSCLHHPGVPFFHDAYKGWSCCNKKCTDFTEFLNIKGCKRSPHNPVKPAEPEKPVVDNEKLDEIIAAQEAKKSEPLIPALERPPFETPLVAITPQIAPALEQQLKNIVISSPKEELTETCEIPVGTSCKNGGCKVSYEGPDTNNSSCTYHPGCPIFHEGLKFWSCCQKRTTDFASFLEQQGCCVGNHVWIKDKSEKNKVSCRYDWHQTASLVVVSVFAKKYDPQRSSVELNPVRLKIKLYFPEEDNSFDLDLELRGIVDVKQSSVNMLATKLEVKLRKAEPGSWTKLNFPRVSPVKIEDSVSVVPAKESSPDDYVDLSGL